MMQDSYFLNAKNECQKLKILFDEYEYESLAMAFFCISIKRGNRFALDNCFVMNQSLIEYSDKQGGNKSINDYREFAEFFDKLSNVISLSVNDENVVADFGEVKVVFAGKAYKTFIGTGHSHVFSCLSYLNAIAEVTNTVDLFKKLLEYHDELISFFENFNDSPKEIMEFSIPSEELFNRTLLYFKNNFEKYRYIYSYIKNYKVIEQQYFVTYKELLFPLFNTSLIVDVISDLVSDNKILIDSTNLGIITYLQYINELCDDNRTSLFAYPIVLIRNNISIPRTLINFVIRTKHGVIFCLERAAWDQEKDVIRDQILDNKIYGLDFIEIRKRANFAGNISMHIEHPEIKIRFIIYEPHLDLNSSLNLLQEHDEHETNIMYMTSLDLMTLLQFSDNVEEIWNFHCYYTNELCTDIISFSGLSSVFLLWKAKDYYIEKGAISYDYMEINYNYETDYIVSYYLNNFSNYPWQFVGEFMFKYPLAWHINSGIESFSEYFSKYSNYIGYIGRLGKITVFLCSNGYFYNNTSSEELNNEINNIFSVVQDILLRGLLSINNANIEILSTNIPILLHYIFQPSKFYDANVNSRSCRETKYINFNTLKTGNVTHIKFKVNEELLNDICEAKNRIVESQFLIDLLTPLKDYDSNIYTYLKKALINIGKQNKHVGIWHVEINYYWNDNARFCKISNTSYHWARKRIASKISSHGITDGEYFGKDANNIIRKIQKEIVTDFENYIKNFNQFHLQVALESLYSRVIHEISIHSKRYSKIGEIQTNTREELALKIIKEREEYKHNKAVLEYLMESNLFCERENGGEFNENELEQMIAYANWLLVLSDNADFCYFSETDVHINISSEKIIDVKYDYLDHGFNSLAKRIYDDPGYEIRGDDNDKQFYLQVIKGFSIDTGIDFSLLMAFLSYISLEVDDFSYTELFPNVFSVDINVIKSKFLAAYDANLSCKQIDLIVDFLTIKPELLKTCEGKSDFYLPIGKRNSRNNRIELKCLWNHEGKIIYSPVISHFVKEYWQIGFTDFFLPYTIDLNNTRKALQKWKKKYEQQIVFDVENCFKKCGFTEIFHNFDPKKIDRKDKELQLLGDYDVLAVDNTNLKIWIVECKMLSKVGTIYEMYMQQQNFFYKHKEDEHFQRRIDYMRMYYHRILKYLKCDSLNTYSIEPLMVMNKVMFSRYKQIFFKIITISELERYIIDNRS